MKNISGLFEKSEKENPFKDSQARNFSNSKIALEFCPTSFFWSLFNDQHEILLGSRGSGKTILLRMMQYSLLKKIEHPDAKQLIKDKKYIALYVPTNIEFLRTINPVLCDNELSIIYFQFGFNCLLAQTFLVEIECIIDDLNDSFIEQSLLKEKVINSISSMWFPSDTSCSTFKELSYKIDNIFYNFNFYNNSSLDLLPPIFINSIGKPIQSVSKHITTFLRLDKEPTWLLCIDEAEFLDIPHQICINSLFRSYSHGIVIKMATLPFKHLTKKIIIDNEQAEPDGNDFNYRHIEFDPLSIDFKTITDSLCKNRLSKILDKQIENFTLSDFVGSIGQDDLIDYYRQEVGEEKSTREFIEKEIIAQFSEERRKKALEKGIGSDDNRKQVYDKFAPIFFVREMYKLDKKGKHVPGFYAGANIIRRMSEGNPRIFIQIMNQLFESARKSELTPKKQHQVLIDYANKHCNVTTGLPIYGSALSIILESISEKLHDNVHNSNLKEVGNNFKISEKILLRDDVIEPIKLACAYSRLKIDTNSILNGISLNTEFCISNIYSVKFWVPMRKTGNSLAWDGINKKKQKTDLIESQSKQTTIAFE